MRFLAIGALALVLAAPRVLAQEALDPAPATWRGLQLGPEQVFEGEFTTNFETSSFRPDGAAASDAVWLAGWEDRPGDNGAITRRYHLRFVGRRTVEPGRYGRLGAFRNEVLIVRLLEERVLLTP